MQPTPPVPKMRALGIVLMGCCREQALCQRKGFRTICVRRIVLDITKRNRVTTPDPRELLDALQVVSWSSSHYEMISRHADVGVSLSDVMECLFTWGTESQALAR